MLARALLVMALFVAGCGASGVVTGAMVQAAQKRSPAATRESLERGRTSFRKKCVQCHRLPSPAAKSADEWPRILNKMARLAHLSDDEKRDVTDYILAAHDAEP
jgi:cytochrome c5